jgi:acetoin utilization deacetylase AcuC-like enzyme
VKIIFSPECADYESPGHPESPQRVRAASALLKTVLRHQFVPAKPCEEADVLRVHARRLVDEVKKGEFYEPDTPALPGMYQHALRSAGAAIQAAESAWKGEPAFSMMRPPGHHACRDRLMGFCYFNNVAIALAKLLEAKDGPKRVAIVDFDCHHGNGTEDVFRGAKNVLYVSLHQSPCYPGTGLRSEANALNYPLPPHTNGPAFLKVFDGALEEVRKFQPELLAVSAGFDAYEGDPITHMSLSIETFCEIGKRLAALKLRMFAALEGGYSADLPKCIEAFLDGWELAPKQHAPVSQP